MARALALEEVDTRDFAGGISHEQKRHIADGLDEFRLFLVKAAWQRERGVRDVLDGGWLPSLREWMGNGGIRFG